MEAGQDSPWVAQANGLCHWLRVLRPLAWWLVLVLLLFGLRTHERLSARTRLVFSPLLGGESLSQNEIIASLDGQPFKSGNWIPVGRHKFSISHPKAEAFSTNLFIWYGEHDLGEISLKRSTGMLSLEVTPPAEEIVVNGPEFSTSQTNSGGFNLWVPTDSYSIEARYRYSMERKQVSVTTNSQGVVRIASRLGACSIQCNQPGASFTLAKSSRETLTTGTVPMTITELPEGKYQVAVEHNGNRREGGLEIQSGATNEVALDFVYGSASIETEPPGVSVIGADGRTRGVTPLTVSELVVGSWPVALRLDGYEPVKVELAIQKNHKTSLRTNLVSRSYTQAIAAAKQQLRSGNFEAATEAISDALRAKPGDSEAGVLKAQAEAGVHIDKAKELGQQENYSGAIKELEAALEARPDMAQAKGLLSDYTKRRQQFIAAEEKKKKDALAEKAAEERLQRPRVIMESISSKYVDGDFFETKSLTCKGEIKQISSSIQESMLKGKIFQLVKFEWAESEVFLMEFRENFLMGFRQCLIVGGQTKNQEAQILYKVLEFEPHVDLGGLLTGSRGPKVIAVHSSRIPQMTAVQENRIREGLSVVTERIRRGISITAENR